MAPMQRFRSALYGFNREDVVRYIEYLNHQHASKVEQLTNQLQAAQARSNTAALQAQLDAALEKCKALEEQLAATSETGAVISSETELEAYRRAERTERLAKERANYIFTQANAILSEAALKAETAATQIGVIADEAAEQLKKCQESVTASKESFQEAVQALYAIRPEE